MDQGKRTRVKAKGIEEGDQLFKVLAERSFAGLYVVQDGRFRFLNANAVINTGYSSGEIVGMKSDSVVHPDDRARVKRDAPAMLRGESSSPHEFRIITKGGGVRWIMETVSSITYNGRPAILGNSMDITEIKQAGERLRESENLYRTIFETTGEATIIIEADTVISQVNTQFEKMSGYRKSDWEEKKSWTDFVVPEDMERMLRYHRQRRTDPGAAPRSYEFGFIDSEGRVRDVVLSVDMIPGTKKSVASFLDITERKRAEIALKSRERELEIKTHELEELNAALRVLLKHREEDRKDLEDKVLGNVKDLVMPYLERLKRSRSDAGDLACINILTTNLNDIISPFTQKLSSKFLGLTPKEIQVANLIKEGKTTKEIAAFMNISRATIELHRHHIRAKLGLKGRKINLQTHLSSVS